jgi:alpha-tubulin suppressor-like RCC1 family protein
MVSEKLRKHRVCQVAAGYSHYAAVTEDGALFTWETGRPDGRGPGEAVPELGHGSASSAAHDWGVPRRVVGLEGLRIASVALGAEFTIAVTEAGEVYSFGFGDARLGHGWSDDLEHAFLPKRIEALQGIHVASVAAGDDHALALTRSGRVYSWGTGGSNSNVYGLGYDSDDGGGDVGAYTSHSLPKLITSLLVSACGALQRAVKCHVP